MAIAEANNVDHFRNQVKQLLEDGETRQTPHKYPYHELYALVWLATLNCYDGAASYSPG